MLNIPTLPVDGDRVIVHEPNYLLTKDALRQPNVPQGTLTRRELRSSSVYPNTIREYVVYVPAQHDGVTPANLVVFQDGHVYLAEDGVARATVIHDNLIARGELPVTICVFIEPGHQGETIPAGAFGERNRRSFEYDTLSEDYARMLIEEVLPEVSRIAPITDDPDRRALTGISSGGICSFTAAWERPDAFRRVISHVGSFTNIRNGHDYAALIRKSSKRPLKVYLQAGTHDLDNAHGNWYLSNLQLAAALAHENRYAFRLVVGQGGHDLKHGGADLPNALRWIWQ